MKNGMSNAYGHTVLVKNNIITDLSQDELFFYIIFGSCHALAGSYPIQLEKSKNFFKMAETKNLDLETFP